MKRVASKRGASPAQVALKWGIDRGVSVIPKSKHENRIEENFGSLEVRLKNKDGKKFGKMAKRFGMRFNNPSGEWGVKLFDGLDHA